MSLFNLCKEFEVKYKIDCLGMSIPNMMKRIDKDDQERLSRLVESPSPTTSGPSLNPGN